MSTEIDVPIPASPASGEVISSAWGDGVVDSLVVLETAALKMCSGSGTAPGLAAHAGASIPISFPAGFFTKVPIVFVNADSNGFNCGQANAQTRDGFILRGFNPSNASGQTVLAYQWIAFEAPSGEWNP